MADNNKKPSITVLGLGPGDPQLLTRQAWAVLESSTEIYLRTRQHPTTAGFPAGLKVISFDDYYQDGKSFSEVYQRIVDRLIEVSRSQGSVVYAVPGDPLVAEQTTLLLLERAAEEGYDLQVLPGVSFLEPTLAALEVDPLPQMTLSDAVEISTWHTPPFPPDIPVLIGQIYSIPTASNLKLTLMGVYPDEHPVILVHDAGLPSQTREDLALYEIDRSKQIGLRSALYVPPLGEGTSLEAFQNVIARLRAPGGCPWDREQTHQSLRPNLLEETYEALEALDNEDPAAMCEEFGDLLLQIVLHAQIASEYGEFTLNDVFQGIYTKIVRRHPHVFQELELEESDAVIKNWEKLKARERKMNGQLEKGLLDGVSLSLPSLTQGLTYQKRAARVGFEWDRIEGVLDKIVEEAAEIQAAATLEEKESELGDLLFAVVNLARWLEVDAESALRGANQRFKRRFGHIEQRARDLNRELSEMSLEEMDKLWDEAKDLGE